VRWLVVADVGGSECATDALQVTGATQQVSVKWIASLCRLIGQLTLTVLHCHNQSTAEICFKRQKTTDNSSYIRLTAFSPGLPG